MVIENGGTERGSGAKQADAGVLIPGGEEINETDVAQSGGEYQHRREKHRHVPRHPMSQ